ncbi:MAG: hypothetical protein U5K29_16285 [Acidimicrobiales bacterium]|nr:hypothetical protein [Acidimicrobiales bacterium]
MRSTRNHLIRAFTVLAAVLVFGAGIAVAAESTIPSDDSEPSDVVEVLADETHGSVVSAAAQDHREDDDECGDHGAYVSSVAEGLEDCEPVDEAVEDEEEVAEKGEEVAEEEGDEGPPEDSHGSVVSAAAQDHSYDDELR